MKKLTKVAAVTISSFLVVGLGGVAALADTLPAGLPSAPPPLVKPVPRPHIHGTITSVGSGQLTLKTPSKTVTVKLSSGTVYDRGPAQKLNLSDLKAGAEVDVDGSWNNGTFDALHVHLAPPHRDGLPGHPGKKPDGLGGKITGVTSRSLTVKTPDGRTFIVSLTGNTKLDSGPQSVGTSALQAGKDVHIRLASGEQVPPPSPSSTSTVSKTISNLTAAEVDLVPPHWDGTITGVRAASVTIKTNSGQTVTLNLNSHPIIQRGPGNTSSQLTVGMKVHVEGTADGSTVSPTRIDIHP